MVSAHWDHMDRAMILAPADIVIVRGTGLFSDAIRALTRERGEGRGWASHVALAVEDGCIIEALPRGVVEHEMPYETGDRCQVWRPRNISPADRRCIVRRAHLYVGRGYGWTKIALHGLGLGRFAFIDEWPICSWIVAESYARAGYTFGVARGATPDDIHDYCRAHAEKYRRVG